MKEELFVALQRLLPQHLLSRCAGYLCNSKNIWLKNLLISQLCKHYQPNMDEAIQEDPYAYETFNSFFTRRLKPDARPISPASFCSPADGHLSEFGNLLSGKAIKAKGHSFSVAALLGDDTKHPSYSQAFTNGYYATIYLAPRDYHRVHMPCAGTLTHMLHVPGKLFSVNPVTVARIDHLFARNERIVCIFETEYGPMALVLVGAMLVASIATPWAGVVAPRKPGIQHWHYGESTPIYLNKGDEMGHFLLGSTVVMLWPDNEHFFWTTPELTEKKIRMGEALATMGDKTHF